MFTNKQPKNFTIQFIRTYKLTYGIRMILVCGNSPKSILSKLNSCINYKINMNLKLQITKYTQNKLLSHSTTFTFNHEIIAIITANDTIIPYTHKLYFPHTNLLQYDFQVIWNKKFLSSHKHLSHSGKEADKSFIIITL